MITRIVKVLPLSKREYTDRNGQKAIFKTKAFILHDGKSSLYGEAIQENAESIDAMKLTEGVVVNVHFTMRCREYKTEQGEVRYSNEVTITNMMKL